MTERARRKGIHLQLTEWEELFFELLAAAEEWRDTMVFSNRRWGDHTDEHDRAHWAGIRNHNGRLVRAVDAALDKIGSAE